MSSAGGALFHILMLASYAVLRLMQLSGFLKDCAYTQFTYCITFLNNA